MSSLPLPLSLPLFCLDLSPFLRSSEDLLPFLKSSEDLPPFLWRSSSLPARGVLPFAIRSTLVGPSTWDEKSSKGLKMTQNGPKWPKMVQNGPKWSTWGITRVQNGPADIDSIAASLFVLNWLSWQIVSVASDDKVQITILILRRGVLSKKTCRNRKYQTTLKVKEYWFEHYKVIYLVLPLTLCARVITTYLIISWSHQMKMGMQNILMRMKMTTTILTLA